MFVIRRLTNINRDENYLQFNLRFTQDFTDYQT